jgi:predicted alpha/beta-hydrolase family hydrolase
MPEQIRVGLNEYQSVTANIYLASPRDREGITLILAHGAGAGQTSGFMVNFASQLASRGIDSVTFNFSYSEHGRGSPDPNDKLEACYRAVLSAVRKFKKLARNSLAIGGKSMGGRIASQIAAADVGDLLGLVFLGYPLHPPGNPEKLRATHLPMIKAPMLFVQGSRDTFGTAEELRPIVKKLKGRATLHVVEGGDHSLKVPKSAGSQDDVYKSVQDEIVRWLKEQKGA